MAPAEQIDLEVGIPLPYVNPSSDVGQLFEEYHLRLQKACLRGDWKAAEKIHENHPNCFQEKVSRNGDTALHIAAAAGRDVFVKQLLTHAHLHGQKLDLELPNNEGNTALYLAAASGKVNIVHQMRRLKPNLLNIPGGSGMKPIQIAVLQGHDKMVEHLLDHCFHDLSRNEQTDLLIATLENDIYDVAWKIIQKDKDDEIATRRNGNSQTPLHILARKTHIESRSYLKYDWIPLRKQHQDDLKNEVVENLWRRVISSRNHQKISELLSFPQPELLFVAIRMGNYEFVTTLIRHYPDLIWEKDHQRRTIFHAAVEYRQEKIFSHILQLQGISHLLTAYTNPINRNNILHLAATLPDPQILGKAAPGAALQMQRELLWFQAVESIVPREYAHSENSILTQISDTEVMESTETPREMFNREHEQLRKDGENWMRKTSTSCMVVAALVATIVFQAIYQPPNKQSNEKLFWVFVISDAFSLLSSTASILTFLSILTSTYAEEDFLVSSLKLMVGLVLLLFSILAILLVFTVSIIILLPYDSVWIIVAVFAWFTGVIYLRLHFPLLVVVYRSTFGAKYLFRHQHELFRD